MPTVLSSGLVEISKKEYKKLIFAANSLSHSRVVCLIFLSMLYNDIKLIFLYERIDFVGQTKIDKLLELESKIDNSVLAKKRIISLFDEDTFTELNTLMCLNNGGVICGYGYIQGKLCYAFSQDISNNNGAVTALHAEKIDKIYSLAVKTGSPVIAIYDSNGAKIDQGAKMMSCYAKILKKASTVSGIVPQIALVLGVCSGISSMLALSADFVIMNKQAELFMASPFITDAKADAKNAVDCGLACLTGKDDIECIELARNIITLMPQNNLSDGTFTFEYEESLAEASADGCPKDIVKSLADKDSLIELYSEYGKGIYTFLGTLAGNTVGFLITSKQNKIDNNSCQKASKMVNICDAFNIPVVTFVNTIGFDGTAECIKAAAVLSNTYAQATTAKVSVIIGNAFGASYVALACKNLASDITFAWSDAKISALPIESAVEFLWSEKLDGVDDVKAKTAELTEKYINTVASPVEYAINGEIDDVISIESTRQVLINTIDMLGGKRENTLPKKHSTI